MVHQYKLNGYNIVLDSESGSIHTVDDVAYDVIELYQNTPKDDIAAVIAKRHGISAEEVEEIIQDIEELKTVNSSQKIFSQDKPIFLKKDSL